MRAAGHEYSILKPGEIDLIHQGALRILDEMGMRIENERLLRLLGDAGLAVDLEDERVCFPTPYVEQFIAEADKYDWDRAEPRVSGSAGVYHSLYHDPASGALVPWTEEALAAYCHLARRLPHVDGAAILGCRLPVPPMLEPLYERAYAWRYGARESGSIHQETLCPYILELYRAFADERRVPLAEVFTGTVYLVPPLKLARHEAAQVAYFLERGLRVHIGGGMPTMGATAPVTLAGAVTLNLAEQLALNMLNAALWGAKRLHLGCSISVMDMRTTIRPFGRPEMALANLMTAHVGQRRRIRAAVFWRAAAGPDCHPATDHRHAGIDGRGRAPGRPQAGHAGADRGRDGPHRSGSGENDGRHPRNAPRVPAPVLCVTCRREDRRPYGQPKTV